MSQLKANVIANLLGQGWRAAMSLAFVPVYIRALGSEAYGLIGLYASLQAWLFLIDMGLRPTLVREMARLASGQHDAQSIRDLLRTAEVMATALCTATALLLWLASGWLARHWLNVKLLPMDTVAQAIAIMSLVAALQVLEGLYAGSIAGLEHQVTQNFIMSFMATLRGVGGAVVVTFLAPSITAFFVWQSLVAALAVMVTGSVLYHLLPQAARAGRFSTSALRGIGQFAGGMSAITVLVLLLTQVDKLLLASLLPLSEFAHYTLASVVASALFYLYSPVVAAYFPRLSALSVPGAEPGPLSDAYHLGAQLVTVLAGSTGAVLAVFAEPLLRLWTGDAELARAVAPLLTLLTLGSLLNGLMALPYHLQLAHGWLRLTIAINSVAVVVLVTALFVLVPRYGAPAAAAIFLVLNGGYVTIGVWLMHRRLLPQERWRWYLQDTALPLAAMMALAWIASRWMPTDLTPLASGAAIIGVGLLTLLLGAALAGRVRQLLRGRWLAAVPMPRS